MLGTLGTIVPLAAGILTWLTPLAAIGLTIIQLLAILTEHLPKREYNVIPVNIMLLGLSVPIAFGRLPLLA